MVELFSMEFSRDKKNCTKYDVFTATILQYITQNKQFHFFLFVFDIFYFISGHNIRRAIFALAVAVLKINRIFLLKNDDSVIFVIM
jgi:hypothetical protein